MSIAFKPILDNNLHKTSILVMRRPPSAVEMEKFNTNTIIGICSNRAFPAKYPNLAAKCRGWCHCFRHPEKYLPADVPRLLLSESDFVDYKKTQPIKTKKEYDFGYVCLKSQKDSKNYNLFLMAHKILCDEMKLNGLVMGMKGHGNRLTFSGLLGRAALFGHMSKCRFMFFTNKIDASPRVLAESVALDIPVLVNENILGGWKYVNDMTGLFFKENLTDIKDAATRCLSGKFKGRKFFFDEFGANNCSLRLSNFLKQDCGLKIKTDRCYIPVY